MRKGQWLQHPPVFLRQSRQTNECDVRIEAIKQLGLVALAYTRKTGFSESGAMQNILKIAVLESKDG